jgi:hypothetical protein
MAIKENTQHDFLISEYNQTNQYLVNVEKSMLDLLKLYNSVLAIIVPVSALIIKFLEKKEIFLMIALMLFVFFLLGLYILGMYIELRIRKIKTLEQIAVYREKFIEINPPLFSKYLKMIKSIETCPPYLRRPSSEWYTVIYISLLDAIAIATALLFILLFIDALWCLNWSGAWKLPLFILFFLVIFLLFVKSLFLWSTCYCHIYDLKREGQYHVKNEYSLLDPRPYYFPRIFRPFDWLARRHEKKVRRRYEFQQKDIDQRMNFKRDCEFCKILKENKEVVIESQYFFANGIAIPSVKDICC